MFTGTIAATGIAPAVDFSIAFGGVEIVLRALLVTSGVAIAIVLLALARRGSHSARPMVVPETAVDARREPAFSSPATASEEPIREAQLRSA